MTKKELKEKIKVIIESVFDFEMLDDDRNNKVVKDIMDLVQEYEPDQTFISTGEEHKIHGAQRDVYGDQIHLSQDGSTTK